MGRLVQWAGGRKALCLATGIKEPNLSAYLLGTKSITWRRLEKATRHVLGEPPAFKPLVEGHPASSGPPTLDKVPRVSGLYAFFDSAMRVIYFGKATDLYAEIRQTWERPVSTVRPWSNKKLRFKDVASYVSAYKIIRGDASFRHDVEALALRVLLNNTFNKNRGKFTRTA